MRIFYLIIIYIFIGCSCQTASKAHYNNMTHEEKLDVNYDARETQRTLEYNLKHKEKNFKKREKLKARDNKKKLKEAELKKAEKKRKNYIFNFY